MPDEMSQSEQAAFAAMQAEQAVAPASAGAGSEPEPAEPEQEAAEPPPPEADPGEAPDAEAAPPQPAQQPKFVRQEALREERERRYQLEAENRRLSEERARFDERLKVIQEMQQPAALPSEKPDRNVDPLATIEYLEQEVERLKEGGQRLTAEQQRQVQIQQITDAADYDATIFGSKVPDYGEAFQYWWRSRAAEMQAYGVPDHELKGRLEREQLQIAENAFQRRMSPAEMLYRIAHQRGYTGKAAARNGNNAEEHIERVATGQSRSPTLSGTGGGATSTKMTAEQLLSMSNDEFDAWTSKNPAATARLMGKDAPRKRA